MGNLPKPVLIIGGIVVAVIIIVIIMNGIKSSSGNQTVTPASGTGTGTSGLTSADLLTQQTQLETDISNAIATGNTSTLASLETDLANLQTELEANQTSGLSAQQTWLQSQLALLQNMANPAIDSSTIFGNWSSTFGGILAGNPTISSSESFDPKTNTYTITNNAQFQEAYIQSLIQYMPQLKNVPYQDLVQAYQYMFVQNPSLYLNVPGAKDSSQATQNQIAYFQNLLSQWQAAGYVNVTGLPTKLPTIPGQSSTNV